MESINSRINNVSIVTAHFNEGPIFLQLIDKWYIKLNQYFGNNFEIIIIDDHSNDYQFEKLNMHISNYDQKVKLFRNNKNLGAGYSFKIGIDRASKEYIVTIDSDGQFNLEDFIRHFDKIKTPNDVLIFERLKKKDSWFYFYGAKLSNNLCNLIFATKFNDFTSAYKVFPKNIINTNRLLSKQMNYSVDHTAHLILNGANFIKIFVNVNDLEKTNSFSSKVLSRGVNRILFILLLFIIRTLHKRSELIWGN